MKKIIETVAEGGGELGVHMYPFMVMTCDRSASLTYAIILDDLVLKYCLHLGE